MLLSDHKLQQLHNFTGDNLTQTLSRIERDAKSLKREGCAAYLDSICVVPETLGAAADLKRLAAQINVTIHALGILRCLPHILEPGETVEYVSLGAGNTGRKFDLETNLRVAEFKFIHWTGSSETIRQNNIFKDYFALAEHDTPKRKYLYLLGTDHALKFFRSGRALESVLSKNAAVNARFAARFGQKYQRVRDYYDHHQANVIIADMAAWLPELSGVDIGDPTTNSL